MRPVIRARKGEYQKVFEDARRSGYVRVRVDGSVYDLSEEIKLEKNKKHNIEIIVDRLVIKPEIRQRLTDSVETASSLAGGLVIADMMEKGEIMFSQNYACPDCGISIEELTPRMFSFNNPYGACPTCTGLGMQLKIDPDRVIPNTKLSILQGAVKASGFSVDEGSIGRMYFDALSKKYGFSLDVPVCELPKEVIDLILYGTKGEKLTLHWKREGAAAPMNRLSKESSVTLNAGTRRTTSEYMRAEIEECMSPGALPGLPRQATEKGSPGRYGSVACL